jgi:hypothetical protein
MSVGTGKQGSTSSLNFLSSAASTYFPLPLPACAPAEIAACPPASRKIERERTRNRDSRQEKELEPEGKDEVVEKSGVAARAAH